MQNFIVTRLHSKDLHPGAAPVCLIVSDFAHRDSNRSIILKMSAFSSPKEEPFDDDYDDEGFAVSSDEEDAAPSLGKHAIPKLAVKRDTSEAIWRPSKGLAEVVKLKGKLWATTGIVRDGKLFYHIEDAIFMAQKGALKTYDEDGKAMLLKELYELLLFGVYGCSWESYQVYSHLKSLGYIVRRHDVLWSNSTNNKAKREDKLDMKASFNTPEGSEGSKEKIEGLTSMCIAMADLAVGNRTGSLSSQGESNALSSGLVHSVNPNKTRVENSRNCTENDYSNYGKESHTKRKGLKLAFDVYLPNAKFKKSNPGIPMFSLCIKSESPPQPWDVEELSQGIPVKFATIIGGQISILSLDTTQLQTLP